MIDQEPVSRVKHFRYLEIEVEESSKLGGAYFCFDKKDIKKYRNTTPWKKISSSNYGSVNVKKHN